MDSFIGHFEVARETGPSCTMGMFRGRFGFFFGAYKVAQKTGSKFFPSVKHFVTTPSQSESIVILKCPMTRDGQLP